MDSALEEILRFEPPVQALGRVATEDMTLDGAQIRRGQHVLISFAAANRDPATFDDPNRFEISRNPNPHLSFSGGIHSCSGMRLARMVGQVALTQLLDQFPGLRIENEPPQWAARNLATRRLTTLPVAW